MSDNIQITAQVVGVKTLKSSGGFRVELDCFESKETDIAQMAILANRRVTALVTFENITDPGTKEKKGNRRPGGKINKEEAQTTDEKAVR